MFAVSATFAGASIINGTVFQNIVDPNDANDPANWNTAGPYATFTTTAISYDSRVTGYTPDVFLKSPTFTTYNLFDPNADLNNTAFVFTGMQWLSPGLNNFYVTHDDGVYVSIPGVGFTLDASGPTPPEDTYFTVTNPGAAGMYAFTLNYAECCGSPAVLETNLGTTPEPGTLMMLGSGILGIAAVMRRKLNL
jgi:hypothetical protein